MTDLICSDCGYAARQIGPAVLRKGSSVREPGEALCASCSSHRVKLVREVDALPRTLDQIRAKRMETGR